MTTYSVAATADVGAGASTMLQNADEEYSAFLCGIHFNLLYLIIHEISQRLSRNIYFFVYSFKNFLFSIQSFLMLLSNTIALLAYQRSLLILFHIIFSFLDFISENAHE